ncbi:cryptococcal mannosyltransferase 1-domain-containing protein [Jimgerdemannia flammicorona]|uniref:Cryptococcal mannosyltransferase 1-domain-containing protein n=2 Tax=Jimgerdemannia flammicorona TaxID=994334 RepID=A0A433D2H9_9FUNG|nr:cryptococcal mannosyltransferase 1-domain-containing protein [Jimgerdemannia flammicorona]RUS30608.1 cryptococcal mannosyltransferase 1-domain-containing protein [Jimgerdemannia flammicorona]
MTPTRRAYLALIALLIFASLYLVFYQRVQLDQPQDKPADVKIEETFNWFADNAIRANRPPSPSVTTVEERLRVAEEIIRSILSDSQDFITRDCTDNVSDEYKQSVALRYANLSYAPFPTKKPRRYFFALNLYDNEAVLPDLALQLVRLIAHLGPSNVFVSVFENGSTDRTPQLLQTTFARALKHLGADHSIKTSTAPKPSKVHRIEYLAHARNRALEPLHILAAPPYDLRYDHVLFINDIFVCHNDLLELLYQQRLQRSHITCGLDYDLQWGDVPIFYDTWVARDVKGLPFFKDPGRPLHSAPSMARYQSNLPFQAYCCWNGVAVLDPTPLYDEDVRFRAATPHPHKPPEELSNTDATGGECGASECSLLCKDYWASGHGRVLVVSRVKVAYEAHVYKALHERPGKFGLPADGQFWPRDRKFEEEEGRMIEWDKGPDAQFCIGYHEKTVLAPWEQVMWEDVPVSLEDPLRPAD